MKTRFIEGIITTVAPLHVAAFEEASKNAKGENIKRTTSMQFVTDHGLNRVPVFPANDLRGRMRRVAAAAVMETLKPVPIDVYQTLTTGAAGISKEAESIKLHIESREDIYLGLFGGGNRIFQSGMRVSAVTPVTHATMSAGLVSDKHASAIVGRYTDEHGSVIVKNLTNTYSFSKVDNVLRGNDHTMPETILNYEEVAYEYASGVAQNGADRREVEEKKKALMQQIREETDPIKKVELRAEMASIESVKKSDNAMIFAVEAIMPGVPMHVRIDFDEHLTDAQVFFAARCLLEVLNNPIGGLASRGFGKVKIERMNLVEDGVAKPLYVRDEEAGKCYVNGENIPGEDKHQEQLAAYSIERVRRLLTGDENADAEKKAKKVKA